VPVHVSLRPVRACALAGEWTARNPDNGIPASADMKWLHRGVGIGTMIGNRDWGWSELPDGPDWPGLNQLTAGKLRVRFCT
jgi:hypothetical protein